MTRPFFCTIRRTGERSTTRWPSCWRDAQRDLLRAAHEAPHLRRRCACRSCARMSPGWSRCPRRRCRRARTAATARAARRRRSGASRAAPAGGTSATALLCLDPRLERLPVPVGGARRGPRRVDRHLRPPSSRAAARPARAPAGSPGPAARCRSGPCRCTSSAGRRRCRRCRPCRRCRTCRRRAAWPASSTWSCVGPTNVPPRSDTLPPPSSWFCTRPPTTLRASSTTTDLPALTRSRAAVRPANPAPTTHTSAVRVRWRFALVLVLCVFASAAPGNAATAPVVSAPATKRRRVVSLIQLSPVSKRAWLRIRSARDAGTRTP